MTEERVREVTRQGPFIATEAREAGFVDGFAYDDELERATKDLLGADVRYVEYADETRARAPSSARAASWRSCTWTATSSTAARSTSAGRHAPRRLLLGRRNDQAAAEDRAVRAVVLRIESPGGSSLASDVMWRELMLLGQQKPLVVSMGTVAASGGYYVASASREIFALPLTITGSSASSTARRT